jgi:hypothetical protein
MGQLQRGRRRVFQLTLSQLGKIFALEQIIRLQEDLSQTRRPGRVVSIIEPVESVEFLMGVHV